MASPVNAAIRYDIIDDLVDCGDCSEADTLSSMTVMAWIRPNTIGEGSAGRIVKKGAGTTNDGWRFTLAATNAVQFITDYGTTDLVRTSNNNQITMSVDSCVVVVTDLATTAGTRFFVNDTETTYGGLNTNSSGTRTSDDAGNLYIGSDSGLTRTFDGIILEAAVWSSQLTRSEISLISNSKTRRTALQVSPSTLVGYWTLDQCGDFATCSGTNLFQDGSGNSNHCTPTNSPSGRAERVLSYP